MAEPRVVQVDVYGQKYPIRTLLEPEYVQELAAFVEERMRLAANVSPSSDIVGLAILAALNITDELYRTRDELTGKTGTLATRTAELEKIVDQALALAE